MKKNFRKISLVAGFVTLVCFGANAQWLQDASTLKTTNNINIRRGVGGNNGNPWSPFLTIGDYSMSDGNKPQVFFVNNTTPISGLSPLVSLGFNLGSYESFNLWRCNTDGAHNGGSGIVPDIYGNLHFFNVESNQNPTQYQDVSVNDISKKRTMSVHPGGLVEIGNNGTFASVNIPNDVKLAVNGRIYTTGIKVSLPNNDGLSWPDYVFKKDYVLTPLSEVETFIAANSHLPNVPSEAEVKENGINMAEMDAVLLRKIEELTLYMIQLKKENEELNAKIDSITKRF